MSSLPKYFLVDSTALPEVYSKVIEVKKLLSSGKTKSIHEAVKLGGISRSAFYKYKDYVFPFYEASKGKVITLYIVVEDLPGILSKILGAVANAKASILTINQSIPINGLADITISIKTEDMVYDIQELMESISSTDGVKRQEILARE